MSQRTERVAGEIRAVLGAVLARQDIKDPRVRNAGLITVTHVRLSGDLRQARVYFTVHGASEDATEAVRRGLESAAGYLRRAVADRLRTKATPTLSFEADRVLEQASRVEALLREVAAKGPDDPRAPAAADGDEGAGAPAGPTKSPQ